MFQTLRAIVRKGRIELLEQVPLAEGTQMLVTVFPNDDDQSFWLNASQSTLDELWGNSEDDVYAELLER